MRYVQPGSTMHYFQDGQWIALHEISDIRRRVPLVARGMDRAGKTVPDIEQAGIEDEIEVHSSRVGMYHSAKGLLSEKFFIFRFYPRFIL